MDSELLGDMLSVAQRLGNSHQRVRMLPVFGVGDGLTDIERRYVEEYCIDCDRDAVAGRLGLGAGDGLSIFRQPAVQAAIKAKLLEEGQYSALKAEYIRDYVFHLLEFCPTDYFDLAPDGSWVVTPEKFAQVPRKVKRYVQSVEVRRYGNEQQCVVKFVSKADALRLAAKYTLVEKVEHDHHVTLVPWDSLVLEAKTQPDKLAFIEQRITDVESVCP